MKNNKSKFREHLDMFLTHLDVKIDFKQNPLPEIPPPWTNHNERVDILTRLD